MRRRNTMERWEYRLNLLFWSIMGMFWYRTMLFRPALALSSQRSRALLWLLVLELVVIGHQLSQRTRRTGLNVALTVLFPFEVYTLLAYGPYFPVLAGTTVGAGLLLSAGYALWVYRSPIRRPEERWTILLRRTAAVLLGGRSILAVCTLVVMGAAVASALRGGVVIRPDQRAQDSIHGGEDTISNHIEEVCKLNSDTWETMSLEERMDLLQTIANIERNFLGVDHELPLGAGEMEEGTLGKYNPVTNQIVLSLDHLAEDDVFGVLDTVLHECYHAYQHSLVDLYGQSPERYRDLQLFDEAREYAEEMADYQSGEDFTAYYTQRMERDARVYAAAGVNDYKDRIIAHLTEGN